MSTFVLLLAFLKCVSVGRHPVVIGWLLLLLLLHFRYGLETEFQEVKQKTLMKLRIRSEGSTSNTARNITLTHGIIEEELTGGDRRRDSFKYLIDLP